MTGDILFLSAAAVVFFLFALSQGICLVIKRNKTGQTTGTVVSIVSPAPENVKMRNSKWAVIAYKVNGRRYTSQNRIQVPMTAQIGSLVTVRYDLQHPKKLYCFSLSKVFLALLIFIFCIIGIIFMAM